MRERRRSKAQGALRLLLCLCLSWPYPGRAAELEVMDRLTATGAALFRSSTTWSGMSAPALSPSGRGGIYFDLGDPRFKVSENGGPYYNLLGGYWTRPSTLIYPATLSDRLGLGRSDIASGVLSVSTNATATPALFVNAADGRVGVGTTAPGQPLDVQGSAQFGALGTKSAFSASGALTLPANAGITLSGASGNYNSGSSVTASAFFGNGAGLTGAALTDATKVLKIGDTITPGALTMSGASANIVSGSSFTTSGGFFGNGAGLTRLPANNFTAGLVPTGRMSGSYTSITGLGTLTAGTWNASTVALLYGGTGGNTAALGRAGIGAAVLGSNNDITALTALAAGGLADSVVYGQDIANSTITLNKLNPSGCTLGQVAKYNGAVWACAPDDVTDNTRLLKAGDTMTPGALAITGAASYIVAGASITTAGGFFGNGPGLTTLNATELTAGAVPSTRLSGSYASVTGVGTLTAGTWNASAVPLLYGGTGANSASGARTALGLSATGSTRVLDHTGTDTSLDITGSAGGYSGITFSAVTGNGKALMVHNTLDIQGFYNESGGTWSWYFQDGQLVTGTVPSGSISGPVPLATTATNLSGGAAVRTLYQTAPNTTGLLTGGTAGYLYTANGASAPSWNSSITIPGYASITGASDPSGNLRFTAANPYIYATSAIRMPGGLYVNGGTPYFQNQMEARGGLFNDLATFLTFAGGTSAITYIPSSGKMGVGNSAPTTALHVSNGALTVDGTGNAVKSRTIEALDQGTGYGNLALTTETGALPGYPGQNYPVLKTSGTNIYFSMNGAYSGYMSDSQFVMRSMYDQNGGGEVINPAGSVSLNTAGKMGIGIWPGAMVDVSGNSPVDFGVYDVPVRVQGDTYSYLELIGATNQAGITISNGGVNGWLTGLNNNGLFRISTMSAISQTGLTNAKDGAEGLTIDLAGRLGLNTLAPGAPVHIVRNNANEMVVGGSGDGVIDATTFIGMGLQFDLGAAAIMASYPGGTGRLTFWTTSGTMAERMRIASNGQVYIGATSGAGLFYVRDFDDAGTADIAQFLANNLTAGLGIGYNRIEAIGTNATGAILLLPKGTGKVGINTTSPQSELYINGELGSTDWLGAGCESACESSGGYALMYANGNAVVYPGAGESPAATLGLYTADGSLPGYPTNNYPTLKTSYTYLYFSISGFYSAYMNSAGALTAVSSRKRKTNFEKLDKKDILDRIGRLEVSRWNFKNEDPSIQHIGPIAESFHELFDLNGSTKTMLSHVDPSGVALVGVQALIEDGEEQDRALERLERSLRSARRAAPARRR